VNPFLPAARLAPPPRAPFAYDLPLEGLRGICALLVLYAHVFAPVRWLDPGFAPSPHFYLLEMGTGAVLMFFVLSGYVIGLTTREPAGGPAIGRYLGRRASRLVPINTAAVLLCWLLVPALPAFVVFGNLLFLQNDLPYGFGWTVPIIGNDRSLWSLNYEAVYYVAFIAVWLVRPRSGTLILLVFAAAVAGIFVPWCPQILSRYACGALYWLGGLAIAWQTAPASSPGRRGNWPSALLALMGTWRLAGLKELLALIRVNGLWAVPASPHRLDMLPVCIWVLLAVTGRAPRWHRPLALLCLGWATTVALGAWALRLPDDLEYRVFGAALILLAWILVAWTPEPRALARLARVGTVSYAVYAIGLPLQWELSAAAWLPAGSAASFLVRASLLLLLVFSLSWVLERRLQPIVRRWLKRPTPAGA